MTKLLAAIPFFLLFIISCKTSSKVAKTTTATAAGNKAASMAILDSMQAAAFKFEWFTGKAKIEISEGSDKTEFTANFRIRNDSAIWVSISPALGLEVARVLLTRDSIRVIDRLNNDYYSKDYQFFRKYTSQPVNLQAIQQLIEGNPVLTDGKSFDVSMNDSAYFLKWEKGAQSNSVTLDKKYRYRYQSISDSSSGTIFVEPSQYDIQYNPAFSLWRKIELLHPDKTTIVVTFSKVKINEPVKLPFKD